jgi:hypothetical protein
MIKWMPPKSTIACEKGAECLATDLNTVVDAFLLNRCASLQNKTKYYPIQSVGYQDSCKIRVNLLLIKNLQITVNFENLQ